MSDLALDAVAPEPPPIRYYDQPRGGQRFILQLAPGQWQEGHIVGLTVTGEYQRADGTKSNEWYAVLQFDTTQEYRFNSRTRLVDGANQWQPAPEEAPVSSPNIGALEQAFGALSHRVHELALTVATLRLMVQEPVDVQRASPDPSAYVAREPAPTDERAPDANPTLVPAAGDVGSADAPVADDGAAAPVAVRRRRRVGA